MREDLKETEEQSQDRTPCRVPNACVTNCLWVTLLEGQRCAGSIVWKRDA